MRDLVAGEGAGEGRRGAAALLRDLRGDPRVEGRQEPQAHLAQGRKLFQGGEG